MRISISFFALFLSVCSMSLAQGGWQTTSAGLTQRYDDIYFINADTGWAIAPWSAFAADPGKVLRTTDGGTTWETQVDSSGMTYRSMAFFDANDGFIGVLEQGQSFGDSAIMLHTTNGGQDWLPVNNLPGPRPAGGCGMFIVGDSTMYAVGRYYGPSHIYKTTDRGQTWDYTNVDSLAGGLVDAYFWTPDSGMVVGTTGDFFDSSGVILHTYDGGQSWERHYVTQDDGRMCWKISFPSRNIGYVSVQQFGPSFPAIFLKTTDGGNTWTEHVYRSSAYNAQGIGFINDTIGWIGGNFSGSLNFFTSDGGMTWSNDLWGVRVNRFRKINDSLFFASGRRIHKWTGFPMVNLNPDDGAADWDVSPAWPNPSSEMAWLELKLPAADLLMLQVYDVKGTLLEESKPETYPAGAHRIAIPTDKLSEGVYLVRAVMGDKVVTRRLAVQR